MAAAATGIADSCRCGSRCANANSCSGAGRSGGGIVKRSGSADSARLINASVRARSIIIMRMPRIRYRAGAGAGAGGAMIMRRNVRRRQRIAGNRASNSLRSKRRCERDAAA